MLKNEVFRNLELNSVFQPAKTVCEKILVWQKFSPKVREFGDKFDNLETELKNDQICLELSVSDCFVIIKLFIRF